MTATAQESLALALWTWEAAGLEPGETAIFTSGTALDPWLAVAAGWISLRDPLRLDLADEPAQPDAGVRCLRITEPQAAVGWLQRELQGAPGVAAAILTPEAIAADVLLEALPMWSRIVIGMTGSRPATVDFYNNVHRKGVQIASVPADPREMADSLWRDRAAASLAQARRILDCQRLAAQCPR